MVMFQALANPSFLWTCGQAIYRTSAAAPAHLTAVFRILATETNAGASVTALHCTQLHRQAPPFPRTEIDGWGGGG
jgi:hypothetical protein